MIEVRNLVKNYPGAPYPALDCVSFVVAPGSFVVILGRSGSGKTTLFRCLNRLITPDSGEIWMEGKELTQLPAKELYQTRRRIATIFQQYNLIQRRRVLNNVLAARLAYLPLWRIVLQQFPNAEQQWALHCLNRVGLLEFAEQRADRLSGGQQQRVAIARALAQQPAIILADEPIASLDAESATLVLEELRTAAQEQGLTVLCSLHQENFALTYASHIIGLREGKVVVDVPREAFSPQDRARIYSEQP